MRGLHAVFGRLRTVPVIVVPKYAEHAHRGAKFGERVETRANIFAFAQTVIAAEQDEIGRQQVRRANDRVHVVDVDVRPVVDVRQERNRGAVETRGQSGEGQRLAVDANPASLEEPVAGSPDGDRCGTCAGQFQKSTAIHR